MSFIVSLFVPEGIVLAGDSRLTLSWTDEAQIHHSIAASDSNTKIFSVSNRFGLGTFGNATINGIPISGFINRFIEEKITDDTEIDEIPQLLIDFFGQPFGNPDTNFYAIGYKVEDGVSIPHVYSINIVNGTFNRNNFNNEIFYGAIWGGEIEVMMRILNTVKLKQGDNFIDLPDTPIPWNHMTLQDAIDFSIYAVRTTIETIKFQQKEKTVGGPIDIMVLEPKKTTKWINKKDLTFE
jgi:hypothetical protein